MAKRKNSFGKQKYKSKNIRFEDIGITDDVMFGSVFSNQEDCKEFLQRILRIKIIKLTIVEEQKSIRTKRKGKGIRIDVYVRDDKGNSYDIEMQLIDTKELDLRSRYYHSEMDSYQIRRGQKYKNLKQSIVIFVCAFDLFGDNRSIYTFETICRENMAITLQDKRKTYFINIYGDRSGIEKDTINLLDYFKTGEPTDDYTKKLQEKVEEFRCDDEWRENYMTIEMKMDQRFEDGKKLGQELGRVEGEKAGMKAGKHEERISVVKNMLGKGYSEAECTRLGFTLEEIQESRKKNDRSNE